MINQRVAYFKHQPSGCFWYRIKKPMEALASMGVSTHMISLDEDILDPTYSEIASLQVYGVYPFSFDYVLKTMKADGKKIIYDLDDALDFIEPTNPFYFSVKKDQRSELQIFSYADHITVATPLLAEYARKKTDAPITILPNCYSPDEWTFPRPRRSGIRIGFAGSCTHIDDLLIVLPAIASLQKRYPTLTFLIMGFGPGTYEEWLKSFRFTAPPEGVESLNQFEKLIKDIRFEWIPYVDFSLYPATLTNMALDIGICPLRANPFNNARSASKAMEYTLSGALALASNVEAYRHDSSSVLVNDNEWEAAIENFIAFPTKRLAELASCTAWIQENRNISSQVDILKSIYVP